MIVRSEDQLNRIKEFLGELMYIKFVPLMLLEETGVIIFYDDPSVFSIGSVGSTQHQELLGCRLVYFEEFFY